MPKIRACRIHRQDEVQVVINDDDQIRERDRRHIRLHRQHERIAGDPARDGLQAQQARVPAKRRHERINVLTVNEPERLRGGDERRDLPERRGDGIDSPERCQLHHEVQDQHSNECGKQIQANDDHRNQHQGHERQHRKGRVPRRQIHRTRPGHPPEVVTLGINESSERELRALASRGVNAQPRYQ